MTLTKRRNSASSPKVSAKKVHAADTPKNSACTDTLTLLSKHSTIVADTADLDSFADLKPTDATTNPTLVLQAACKASYTHILKLAVQQAQKCVKGSDEEVVAEALDRVVVLFGVEILKKIPGLVSSEVDASLSFDTQGSIEKARKIIGLYSENGVAKDRVLIKIAATWEGIAAARALQKEGINCNITLLFSMVQAVAAAEAGVFLVSPFVGRILDWHVKNLPEGVKKGQDDPGVVSVKEIYGVYKKLNYSTVIMAASFRNTDEIVALSGCDKLTISPKLLQELKSKSSVSLERRLSPPASVCDSAEANAYATQALGFAFCKGRGLSEPQFRLALNENPMATEMLAAGIRNFASDLGKLKEKLKEMLHPKP